MSSPTKRTTALVDGGSVEHRLARLLDTTFLARVVPHLAPETLHQLIRYRGLDACGEIVTSATSAQLTSLLDLDLWRHAQPGHDEQFDIDRFGEWLEVLVDTGDSIAAHTIAALDKDVVIAGLSRYLRVFDPGIFEPTESSDDEAMNRQDLMHSETSSDVLECEVGGYLVRARRFDAWDAIIALLVALEIAHNDDFHAVMRACRLLSNSTPEIDGLHDLQTAPAQHLHEVAIERERRRSQRGYATPADARAFLQLARQSLRSSTESATNPIAAAYFRAAEDDVETTSPAAPAAHDRGVRRDAASVSASGDADIARSIGTLTELLAEAAVGDHARVFEGGRPERPRALLGAADADPRADRLPHLRRAMEFLLHHDESTHLTRSRELAFLANTLLAGCSVQSRPFTPQEASEAAACICNLGLESSLRKGDTATLPDTFLVDHDLVPTFEVGWAVLHHQVSLFTADRLISTLDELRTADADTNRGLTALGRTLAKQRGAGTPWLARDAADILATLDMTAWVSVLGLLDECPILPAALTAILDHRTTSVSPAAFQFISTAAQIADIHRFMTALPGVLAG